MSGYARSPSSAVIGRGAARSSGACYDLGAAGMTGNRTIEAATRDIARLNFYSAVVVLVLAGVAALWINAKAPFSTPGNRPLFFIPAAIAFFGVAYLGNASLNSMRAAKSGQSFLDLEEAMYGASVRGRIHTERPIKPRGDYQLRLACSEVIHVSGVRVGSPSYDKWKVRWETTQRVPSTGLSSTAGIPVNIKVEPFPWPEPAPNSNGFRWTLTINAPLGIVSYSAVFPLEIDGEPDTPVKGHARRRKPPQDAP
ncbi:MAG: hypothetical protein ACHQHM_04295 [Thermoanaerobaculales bacterium]